jgi:hypothetical protein
MRQLPPRKGPGNDFQQLVRSGFRTLECRRIRVGHRNRMEWRVHVAWINRQDTHAVRLQLGVPDLTKVAKRSLARAVGAPRRIGIDGGVAGDVQDHRASAFAR